MHCYLEHSIKVLDLQVRWQPELVADVITSLSGVGDINGENQCLVAEALYAVNNLF